jgi:hypothetical protein
MNDFSFVTKEHNLPKASSDVLCVWFLSNTQALGKLDGSYLVDPASSHMLVSKIKPCMSKYKQLYTVKLRMAH